MTYKSQNEKFNNERRKILMTAGTLGAGVLFASQLPLLTGIANAMPAPEGKYYSENMEMLGYHDLKGRPGFQMAMQIVDGRYYLYMGSFAHQGWTIIEVTDPENPTNHTWLPYPGNKKGTVCPKIQIADGIMITTVQKGLPVYHGSPKNAKHDGGIFIWDVREPLKPKLLSQWDSGYGSGTHRSFYNGGRYVHLSSTAAGFNGHIYRILDISNPKKPFEAGRWWLPDQWAAGGANHKSGASLHGAPYVKGNLVYISYGKAGMVIVDISNIETPQFVGQLDTHPPLGDTAPQMHTVVPLSQRPYAVITSEGRRPAAWSKEKIGDHIPSVNFIGMADVRNPAEPTLVSIFPTPIPPADAPYKNFSELENIGAFGFGPHNLHQPENHPALEDRNDRIYCTYFNAGLRIYDISDPYLPKEIASFIPPDPKEFAFNKKGFPGPKLATVEDVLVDNRGIIYMTSMNQGLWILRCTV
ncbi:MAG: hypothetical protein JKY51_11690 [Opitutaceae bacterium]|nr:hypothetical protein [Opitutaceae bacterium]